MDTEPTPEQITRSILEWPTEKRLELLDTLHESLVDPNLDHGPEDPADEVEAAWKDEIGQRITDIEDGRVGTIPAKDAEAMIRGDAAPPIV